MAKNSHNALRRKGFKLVPLKTVSLRVPSDLWERCGWKAVANGVNRTEFVRDTLTTATRDAKPPELREFRGIAASESELDLWEKSAAYRERSSLEDWVRYILNTVAESDAKDGYDQD